jgi:hypothetical protein
MASDPNTRFFIGIDFAKAESAAAKIVTVVEDFKTSVNHIAQAQAAAYAKAVRQAAKSIHFGMAARPFTPGNIRTVFAPRPKAASWVTLGSIFHESLFFDPVEHSWQKVWRATTSRKAQRKRGPMPADWRETALVVALEGGAFASICGGVDADVLPYLGAGSRKEKDEAQAVRFTQRCAERAWEIVGQRLLSKSRAIFSDWVRCAEDARLKETPIPTLPKLRFFDGNRS